MDKSQLTVKSKNYSPLIGIIIASITFLVHLPALQNGFVNFDDNILVYDNPSIKSIDFYLLGFGITTMTEMWIPLTMLSFAFDYAIWGLEPKGFHLTNIIFHVLNTILVFILTIRLTGNVKDMSGKKVIFAGTVASLLFGIHPLRVESVAWVTERKDVLSAFFFLLSILAYTRYASTSSKKLNYYGASFILFILALMSKPMAASLPFVLLILDFYPLRRLKIENGLRNIRGVLLEKLPFLLSALLLSILIILPHPSADKIFTQESFIERIFLVAHSYIFYLVKILLPFNLAPLYPFLPGVNYFNLEYTASLLLFSMITFFFIRSVKTNKLLAVAWFYYVVTLLPVIGINKIAAFATADRYTYLPGLGPFILIGLGVASIFESYKKWLRYLSVAILSIILGIMVAKTLKQIGLWHDSVTLWSYEIKLYPDFYRAYTNRGWAFDSLGNYGRAIEDYNKAIELNPQDVQAYYNRGNDYNYIGEYRQAINDLSMAIELNPRDAKTYTNRGIAYYNAGGYQQAIADYSTAIRINPRDALAYYNMGLVYARLGDTEQAFYYKKAAGLGLKQASEPAKSGERKPSFR